MTETRPLSKRQKRRYINILTIAADLLSKNGIEGVSIREVAEKADVSAVTLYNVFGSKDDLLSAAVEFHNRSFVHTAQMAITATGFEGLLEINRSVVESCIINEALSRSVAFMLFRDSSLFGVRTVYTRFHGQFIQQIAEKGDLVGKATPEALTYLLMLQNNAALAAWASDEVPTDKLNEVFDMVACNTLHHSTRGETRAIIDECYENRMASLNMMDFATFFKKERGFAKDINIDSLIECDD